MSRHFEHSVRTRGGLIGRQMRNESSELGQLMQALHNSGFEACELIVGVDFTKSNHWNGRTSFQGRSLHDLTGSPNPYMQTFKFMAERLKWLDDDRNIPCYGFGDVTSSRDSVFSFNPGNKPCPGLNSLLERYRQITSAVNMSGPTSFGPLIRQAMREVHNSGMKFHVLLILADGQISQECLEDTTNAIIDAAEFPMSIVMIGVGDGPWEEMKDFDNKKLPERAWDNFQFIELDKIINGTSGAPSNQGERFEAGVLEEIPVQFAKARTLVDGGEREAVRRIINKIPVNLVKDPPVPRNN